MASKKPVTTKDTMAPEHLPEGSHPGEFLADADLPGYYTRAIEATDDEDEKAALRSQRTAARRAAALTAALAED